MEPLLTAFVAALLGGWADKTQRLSATLSARYRPAPVLAALLIVAAVNSTISAFAGILVRRETSPHAAALLLVVALVFAGVAGLIGEAPKAPKPRGGAFTSALVALGSAGWGDKTQYVTAALAAYYDSFLPVAAAAFAGTLAVALPAALGGGAFERAAPLTAVRILAAVLFLLAGALMLVNTLGLTGS